MHDIRSRGGKLLLRVHRGISRHRSVLFLLRHVCGTRRVPVANIIVVYELLEPTDEVIAHHRRAFAAGPMRVLEGPEVELVANDGYIEAPDAPNEVYRLIFKVEPVR